MKRLLLTMIIGFIFIGNSEAFQTEAIFNSHSGSKFVLFANGQKINHRPAQQVRLNHLPAGKNNLRVRYWNNGISCDVWQTVFLQRGHESTFKIRPNRYGDVRIVKTGSFRLNNRYGYDYRPNNRFNRNGKFQLFMDELKSRRFDEKKFAVASRYLNRNDLTANQLRRIVRQFSFDDTKVDFILNAYDHVIDKQNFYLVYDELRFRSSIRTIKTELGFIGGRGNGRNGRGNGGQNGRGW
ncbi:MAG: DUF4476 domain-containing protein [Bacteroidota bacterium]